MVFAKRLEKLTFWLIILTIVLAVLALMQIVLVFKP